MVNLIDKDNVTVGELEKAGQLAIVVNNQQELKELVKNINKIIGEEEGIDLNKKVIFILPKSQKDDLDWRKNQGDAAPCDRYICRADFSAVIFQSQP